VTEPASHKAGPAVDLLLLVGLGGMMIPPADRQSFLKLRHENLLSLHLR
jgi:hypothetical protein